MDHNNILAVVLAGGKSKRFGRDKSQVKLGDKILIDYILSEIIDIYNDILIVANEPIKFLDSNKISLTSDIKKRIFIVFMFEINCFYTYFICPNFYFSISFD